MALRLSNFAFSLRVLGARAMSAGEYGSGSGKGGGAGGSIRDAGGAFGKMEYAHEEQYFRKLQEEEIKRYKETLKEEKQFHDSEIQRHEQAEQLEELKEHLDEEVAHHKLSIKQHEQEEQIKELKETLDEEIMHHNLSIKQHEEAIARHKKRIADIEKKDSDSD